MLHWRISPTAIACAVCVAIACSQSRTKAASTPNGDPAYASASGSADTTVAAPIDCNKIFSPGDAAGLLKPPVKVSAIGGFTGGCHFGNDELGDIIDLSGEKGTVFQRAERSFLT